MIMQKLASPVRWEGDPVYGTCILPTEMQWRVWTGNCLYEVVAVGLSRKEVEGLTERQRKLHARRVARALGFARTEEEYIKANDIAFPWFQNEMGEWRVWRRIVIVEITSPCFPPRFKMPAVIEVTADPPGVCVPGSCFEEDGGVWVGKCYFEDVGEHPIVEELLKERRWKEAREVELEYIKEKYGVELKRR